MTNQKLHNLIKPKEKKTSKRKGRGNASGKGTYAGRGQKGQRSRSGGKKGLKKRSLFRQLIKKTPKLSNFKGQKVKNITITLDLLEKKFSNNDTINFTALKKTGLIKPGEKPKIVATGKINKKLKIANIKITPKAVEMIKKAGGSVA